MNRFRGRSRRPCRPPASWAGAAQEMAAVFGEQKNGAEAFRRETFDGLRESVQDLLQGGALRDKLKHAALFFDGVRQDFEGVALAKACGEAAAFARPASGAGRGAEGEGGEAGLTPTLLSAGLSGGVRKAVGAMGIRGKVSTRRTQCPRSSGGLVRKFWHGCQTCLILSADAEREAVSGCEGSKHARGDCLHAVLYY